MGLWNELPFAVNAGVGALAGDLLLLLGDAAWRRGRPTCVQGTWDSLQEWKEEKGVHIGKQKEKLSSDANKGKSEHKERMLKR